MKKQYLFLISCIISSLTYAQPVDYSVTVTQVNWFEGGFFGPCYEGGTNEYGAVVWFDDNLNGTDVGGNCLQCNAGADCTINPNLTLGTRNNTCAETINIIFLGLENDSGPRCTINSADDCECGPSIVASINFQNNGPGCTTYGNFGCNGSHNTQVEICWDYTTPPPANDDCPGAIAVGAGTTPFTLLEECSGPDITSCAFNDYNDLWYEYTVGNCHLESLTVDTQGSGFDTALSIFDACGGSEIACNDDSGGLQSSITIPGCIDPGTTYYIRVSGYNGADGTGVLNITETLDDDPPTFINCPTQADLPADANCMAAIPDFTTSATATDNCDNTVSITQSPAAGTMVGLGAQTVTLTATDDCTNSTSTCVINFNVIDDTAPVCVAQNVTVNIDATGNASVTAAQIDGGSTDNCSITSTTISAGQTAYTCADVGSPFTVTLTVTDAAGNTSTCDATVTVADPASNCCAPPMAVCQDITVQLDATGNIAITPADIDNGSTAECGLAALTIDNADFDCANIGTNNVTLTITDINGDTDECTAIVTIEDNTPPTASNPPPINVECPADIPAADPAVVTDETDNCSVTVVFVNDESDGDTCPETITRTFSVSDPSGNAIEVTQMIIIEDITPPLAPTPPSDITEQCSADVPPPIDLTASDNCDGNITVSPTEVVTPGTCDNEAIIVRTWTFTDECGNESEVMQTITVNDDTPPVPPTPPADVTEQCAADIPPAVDLTAVDNCDGDITVSPTEVNTPGACPSSFTLVRTWTFTDECGNESEVMQTITVNDDTAPVPPAPPADITEQCAADVPPPVDLTAVDNCDGDITVSPTEVNTPGACPSSFTLVRTWTFTDECGNESEVSQTITVNDDTAPVPPAPPADITERCAANVPPPVDLTAVDNCDGDITVSPTEVNTPGACPSAFTLVRTWTFTDECGNESEVSQTITVNDDTAPVPPAPPADITEQCAANVPPPIDLTATDNCDGDISVSPTEVNTPGACPSSFTLVRTWTFTDECGNTSEVSQTITVNDDTPPVAPTPPADITEQCAADVPPPVDLTATDNCDGDISVSPTEVNTPGACLSSFTLVRTWTFTDACGNESEVSQTITVNDDTAPVPPAPPADITEQCAADVPPPTDLTATDNCDGDITVSPTEVNTPGACPSAFTLVRTWTFIDECGNESEVSQTITVNDDTAPIPPAPPADITEQCAADVPAAVDLTAVDNCDGDITVSPTEVNTPGACPSAFTLVRTWTFTDECGNESEVSQTITVNDDTPPVPPAAPADITEQCAANVPPPVDLTAVDNCDGDITVSPTEVNTPGACSSSFTLVRTWTFTDECGNESEVTQTITVDDTTPPVAPTPPADITEQCAADVPPPVDLTAVDNCDGDITVSPTEVNTPGACPSSFTLVRTWTFTDECGNESEVTQTITVDDTTPPVAPTPPADITEQCTTDVPPPVDLTATDNCDGDITVSPTEVNTPGACPSSFTLVRTWTFTDECGNESEVTQTITVDDTTPPVTPTPPADITEQCAADVQPPVDLTAVDNCDGDITVSPTEVNTPGACPSSFTLVRTWTFTDECGNESEVTQTITVDDTTPPVAPTPPADITEQCAADVPPPVDLTATDNCDGDITVSPTEVNTPGACSSSFTLVRTWTFTDECGNESEVSQTITVDDTTPPVAPTPPADISEQCAADVPPAVDLTATDNCDGDITVSPTEVNTPGACPSSFTLVRTWTFTDECGNESEVSQTITVNDDTPPVAPTPPADITEQCAADVPAPVDLTATDNCDGDITVSPTEVNTPGACPSSFTLVRTWTFTDECGNESEVSQTITVNDDTPPVAPTPPADITEQCAADVPAPVDLTATDNCDGDITVSPTEVNTPGACPSSFTLVRTWTFTDECGNESEVSQTITVDDTTPPVAPAPPADITEQCAADIPPPIDLTATDNCDGDITVSPTEVNTPGACPSSFTLVRTWTFTDECGNTSEVSQTITVDDTTPPVAPTPPADITEQCAADVPPPIDLTAVDNCDGDITVSPTEVNTPGACPSSFTLVRTWTFTDECGNESEVSQTITVDDTTPPVAPTPPADISEQCAADVPPAVDLTATDNCDGDITVSPTEVNTPGACPSSFTLVRTWTFTDECGNESEVSQTITVNDDTPPVAPTPPADITEQCAADIPPAVDLTATDNCDGDITVSPTEINTPGACPSSFTLVRTWTFTDECGNESEVSQTIMVNDDTPPVPPTPPADIIEQCAADVPPAVDLTATDNCDGDISVSPTEVNTPGACPSSFTLVRTWTFTDECGNESEVSQTITVDDTTPPVAPTPPADITEQCAADVPPPVDLTAMDNCDGDITVSPTEVNTPGACPSSFTLVRTWTFIDECGNESSVMQTISVNDDTPPAPPTPPADITEQCAADIPPAVDLTATDNCDGDITVAPTEVNTPGACPSSFTLVRTWTFTDECGNTSEVSQTIIVNDDTPPVAPTPPADITEQCVADIPPPVDLTAVDNCDGDITVSPTEVNTPGACPSLFTLVRTWTFTDECGNESEVSQTITVNDDTPPVPPAPPADITEQCAADVPVPVDLTATDNCDGDITVSPTEVNTPGACPSSFTLVRTWTFTDECGNESEASQTITVNDNTTPTASNPAPVTVQCPADVPAPDVNVVTDEADNCTAIPLVEFISDVSDNATCPETITRTYSVTDECDNSITVTQTIIVNDDTNPTPVCQDISISLDANGQASITVADIENGSTDNCTVAANLNFALNQTTFDCTDAGQVVPVTMTVTDECGNSADCIANVTVNDDAAPGVATCPANISVNNDAGVCEAVVNYDLPTFSDNCDGTNTGTLVAGLAPGSVFPMGVTTVTYEYTDAAGNATATCSFDVEVIDNEAPTAVCQNLTLGLDENFELTITPEDIDTGSTDNCGANNTDLILDMENFDCSNSGTNMVTLTVIDEAGNSSVCMAQVEIPATPEPMITCPENVRDCDGRFELELTDNNPFTFGIAQATISGTAAPFVLGDISPGGGATLNLGAATTSEPLTLTYTLTVGDCPPVSVSCTFTVATSCSDAGSFPRN